MLEYRFWFAPDSVLKTRKLERTLDEQEQLVATLQRRNQSIMDRVQYLKEDVHAVEEQARYELGMVRQGEKYYQVVDKIE